MSVEGKNVSFWDKPKVGLPYNELMQPRYEVIGLWPDCKCKLGEIITLDWHRYNYVIKQRAEYWDKYPNLFKPLPWYDKRKLDDMPEYVRHIYTNQIAKADWHQQGDSLFFANGITNTVNSARYLLPATLQEYQEYQKQTVK